MMAYAGRLPPKGVPFLPEMVYTRVRGWTSGGASPYKHLLNTPLPPRGSNKKREIRKSQKGAAVSETEDDQTGRLHSSYL